MWQGKALGALIGVVAAGPLGAAFGTFIGHLFDVEAESRSRLAGPAAAAGIQEVFFRATFQVMGHLAKSDGRVSEDEIRAARAMMQQLQLGEREVHLAIELFTQGKAGDFPLDQVVRQLHDRCRNRPDLRRMFVHIQLQAALWGNGLHAATRRMLTRICDGLDISAYELVQMEALLRMQRSSGQQAGGQAGGSSTQRAAADRIAAAYEVLGVPRTATDSEVIKSYRRLMNQNHPDKLLAKGLPESMMKMAEEKTRQIRAAYEVLREARGMTQSKG